MKKKEIVEEIAETLSLYPFKEKMAEGKVMYHDDDGTHCLSFLMPAVFSFNDFLELYHLDFVLDLIYCPMIKFSVDESILEEIEEEYGPVDILYQIQIFLTDPIEDFESEGEVVFESK